MFKKNIVVLLLLLVAAPSLLAQDAKKLVLGVSAGTLGVGANIIYAVNEKLSIRGGFHSYEYDVDIENDEGDELDYSGDLDLSNLGLGVDFYPWAGTFRLSAGVQISDNKAQGEAVCSQAGGCDFGGQNNIVSQGDTATVNLDLSGSHPYVMMGWGNPHHGGPFGVSFDLGVMFQGTPKIDVTANCSDNPSTPTVNETQECNNEAENEEAELQEDAEDFEVYPVVNLGLHYRFN